MTSPKGLTKDDWQKIVNHPGVIAAWNLDETDTVASFTSRVYGAKFFHPTLFPQDSWTLYLLSEGTADGISMIIRRLPKSFTIEK